MTDYSRRRGNLEVPRTVPTGHTEDIYNLFGHGGCAKVAEKHRVPEYDNSDKICFNTEFVDCCVRCAGKYGQKARPLKEGEEYRKTC